MPFTKNQIITLEIEALSNDGNGVAHKDGQAVFVPLTAPGDVAEVRIVKPMKTYAFGRVEKLLTAGPGRVTDGKHGLLRHRLRLLLRGGLPLWSGGRGRRLFPGGQSALYRRHPQRRRGGRLC